MNAGALVVDVQDDSPADDAGLGKGGDTIDFQGQTGIPSDGDVVVSVDGRQADPRRATWPTGSAATRAGDKVRLEVLRDGKRRTVEVELGKRPEKPPEGG